MNQCYTVKVKLDKEDTHLLDKETDDSLHNLLILSQSYGCCRKTLGSLKGTVSREKLLNCGLGEMDRTLTIDRT